MKRYTLRHLIMMIIALIVLIWIMYTGIVLRDYRISFTGGPHLEPKITVPGPPGISVDNSIPKKIKVGFTKSGDAAGYEVQISRFSNMFIGKSYRTKNNSYELAKLYGGKKYYIRARSFKQNKAGRVICGRWGSIKAVNVRDD